jgi:hypothetical protein
VCASIRWERKRRSRSKLPLCSMACRGSSALHPACVPGNLYIGAVPRTPSERQTQSPYFKGASFTSLSGLMWVREEEIMQFYKAAAVLFIAGLTVSTQAQAKGFKITDVHFETNSSACDMGIQIAFDTDGLVEGSVEDSNGTKVYSFHSAGGMRATGGQTEAFLEGIEPQITEILNALRCAPSDDEGTSSLAALFAAWPAGLYTFLGTSKGGAALRGFDRLTHHIPAGPKIIAPPNGATLPNGPVLIRWEPVTKPIIPRLGPVNIVGYHVVAYESGGEGTPQFDVDLSSSENNVRVPAQFLHPAKTYQFEVLSTEESGNQTITEGFFCTSGTVACTAPERPAR